MNVLPGHGGGDDRHCPRWPRPCPASVSSQVTAFLTSLSSLCVSLLLCSTSAPTDRLSKPRSLAVPRHGNQLSHPNNQIKIGLADVDLIQSDLQEVQGHSPEASRVKCLAQGHNVIWHGRNRTGNLQIISPEPFIT